MGSETVVVVVVVVFKSGDSFDLFVLFIQSGTYFQRGPLVATPTLQFLECYSSKLPRMYPWILGWNTVIYT